ncbi:unnamed protein product [Nyctereutes procyonoides]|uniref:(raccoon dog) hypothetical protein n=1 Tax=Nyctereutes procyonoides TaxID=34880 RepID=A0A811YU21_NYCPR|nr:unnamed protein product [Nyctereutes procyonoides]
MAGHRLAKGLVTVSLSKTGASVAPWPSSCPNISAGWSLSSSCGFPPSFIKSHSNGTASPYPGSKVEQSQVPTRKYVGCLSGQNPLVGERNFSPKFNEEDGHKPCSWTGLVGRGLFGRWGPNHADNGSRVIRPVSERNVLQFVAIKRKDCGEWAIAGGMVEPGEKISTTLKREFAEEELEKQLHKLFSREHFVVYKGYMDDPQNTDNIMDHLPLETGDDAKKVKWVDISDQLKLYASHSQFIQLVAEK